MPRQFVRYVEPFAGSACVFFELQPKVSVLADINAELIDAYLTIRDNPQEIHQILSVFPRGKDGYIAVRSMPVENTDSFFRAARFIYLNRFCFNGLYRTNKAGAFNVPYGGDRSGELPTLSLLRQLAQCLQNVVFIRGDFTQTLHITKPGDFVYMDPPYKVESRRVFKEYSAMAFSREDVVALRSSMVTLDSRGIKFLVSYAVSAEADILSQGFNRQELRVRRNIAGFASARRDSREVFIYNYNL